MKRIFDIVISLFLLGILVVPMVLIGAVIFLNDRGPVFYRQVRVGKGCVPFAMLKFRTMVVNADKIGGYQTDVGDKRITRIGGILRKTSLDEVPQVLNVLWGDMSLVGPRPDVPAQESLYAPEDWRLRHTVRPGITGLAQASGRSNMDFETRTGYDLDYARRASLWLDLKIMWQTVATVRQGI